MSSDHLTGSRDLSYGNVVSSVQIPPACSVEVVSMDGYEVRVSKGNDIKSTESVHESGPGILVGCSGNGLEGGNGSFGECGGNGSGKEVMKGEMGSSVVGNMDGGGNLIESLDWVMKAAELLVSDADVVAGQGLDGSASSLQGTGVSYDSIIQNFFAQTPYSMPPNKETTVNDKDSNGEQLKDAVENQYIPTRVQTRNIENSNDMRMKKAKETLSKSSYRVSDLVWGKIASHPWWPGQIFDPSDASKSSMNHLKDNCLLVAYFGDGTFAWNESAKVKPFGEHFPKMEKQSNSEAFCLAVDCALDEVGERIEYSLSCPCLSDALYDSLKSQTIRNKGVHTVSRTRETGDEYSDAAAFKPVNLVKCVKILATGGLLNRLDIEIARSQLLSFHCYKGYPSLPEFEEYGAPVDNETDILNMKKRGQNSVIDDSNDELDVLSTEKRRQSRAIQKNKLFLLQFKAPVDDGEDDDPDSKVAAQYGSSRKRRCDSGNKISLGKKHCGKTNSLAEIIGSMDGGLTSTYETKESTTVAKKSNKKQVKTSGNNETSVNEEDAMPPDEECVKGSYWTATVIKGKAEDQILPENQKTNDRTTEVDSTDENSKESRPTALMLTFTDVESVPLAINLNKIFTVYGPLIESKTEVQKNSKRAKVVFENHFDAEVAFGSAGKYTIFGPSLMSYRLKYLPSPTKKRSARVAKRGIKSSAEGDSDTI